jgi:hypothetical protein
MQHRKRHELKPTVGFKLPWAGVTPALSDRKKMRDFVPVRTFLTASFAHGHLVYRSSWKASGIRDLLEIQKALQMILFIFRADLVIFEVLLTWLYAPQRQFDSQFIRSDDATISYVGIVDGLEPAHKKYTRYQRSLLAHLDCFAAQPSIDLIDSNSVCAHLNLGQRLEEGSTPVRITGPTKSAPMAPPRRL